MRQGIKLHVQFLDLFLEIPRGPWRYLAAIQILVNTVCMPFVQSCVFVMCVAPTVLKIHLHSHRIIIRHRDRKP